jgi:histidine triad (HIT) family protein
MSRKTQPPAGFPLSRRSVIGASLAAFATPALRPHGLASPGQAPAADPACVFCKIIAGSREAPLVWQDELCVAFGSLHPIQPGHVLLVPRRHAVNLYDLPADAGAHLLPVASRIARALKSVLRADGLTLLQNSEKASGQSVFHFHLHLIPRREGHEIWKHLAEPRMATQAELDGVLAPVRQALAGSR